MNLRSQNVTTNIRTMSRVNPYVFTEQGIYMVATILKMILLHNKVSILLRINNDSIMQIF
ncbi:ORF6N domain-containing protein [Anaerorhabdus sp.]|uniref:ORF6N domain-containing protein n=1 Tax=Anaerorhabdus sp. TaxID=1872524 RepID=UPI003FA60682